MKTMIHTNNKVLKTFHLATVTCVVTTLLMTVFGGWRPGSQWAHLMTSPQLVPMPAQRCDVLTNMLRGHWQQHNMTAEETLRMRKFYYSKVRFQVRVCVRARRCVCVCVCARARARRPKLTAEYVHTESVSV